MNGFIVYLIYCTIIGAITAAIAASKGRTVVGWFFTGFLMSLFGFVILGIPAIVIIAAVSNKNDEREKEERIERENRRLREQLQQERMKGEAFRQHAAARLDSHDQQMGVDTRQAGRQLPGTAANDGRLLAANSADALPQLDGDPDDAELEQPATEWKPHAATPFSPAAQPAHAYHPVQQPGAISRRMWHYESEGQIRGPVDEKRLIDMVRAAEISPTTLLWTEQLGDWKPAGQIAALRKYLPA